MKVGWMRGWRQLKKLLPAGNEPEKFAYPVSHRVDVNAPGGIVPLEQATEPEPAENELLVTA